MSEMSIFPTYPQDCGKTYPQLCGFREKLVDKSWLLLLATGPADSRHSINKSHVK